MHFWQIGRSNPQTNMNAIAGSSHQVQISEGLSGRGMAWLPVWLAGLRPVYGISDLVA